MSIIKFSTTRENISSNGGLSFVEGLLSSTGVMSLWDTVLPHRCNARFSHQAIVRALVGLLSAGCSNFADIEKFSEDPVFLHLVGESLPSQESFRQRINLLAGANWLPLVDRMASALLRKAKLGRIQMHGMELIPLDMDVSILVDDASRKEGVSPTYHKVNGYAPIFCYAGTQGCMVANQMRPGSQHCSNGAVEFLERCVKIMADAGYEAKELLLRVDSGHDSSEFIQKAQKLGIRYLIKRNQRHENEMQLADSVRCDEKPESPRPGKTIWRGIRSDKKPAKMKDFKGFMVVEATERIILASGERLLIPELEVESWWTNLPFSARECVGLYHDHGTSEQFHSELKTDMGIELLPSGKFATNALILGLSTIAFNCLRLIGDAAIPAPKRERDPRRLRLRTVLLDFIKVGCKLVRHANALLLKVSRNFPLLPALRKIEAIC